MNSAIIVVLVLLWGVDCRPVRQDVLAGADFLAFFMRSHRPRSQQVYYTSGTTTTPSTTVVTTEATTTATETETIPTTLETEPPSVVSVRVSSSVRKEAVHEAQNVIAAAQRSHFSVESSGYREEEGDQRELEDSVAEATHEFSSTHEEGKEEKKPYAEALTLEESGIGYETRVSSETSQSRIYFSQPKVVSESVVVQTSAAKKYDPHVRSSNSREERKLVPQVVNENVEPRKYNRQQVISQTNDDVQYQTQQTPPVTPQKTQYEVQNQIVHQDHNAMNYDTPTNPKQRSGRTYQQKQLQQREERTFEEEQEHQERAETNYETAPVNQERGEINYESPPSNQQQGEGNYEHQEQNYEVDEAISVMTNGRAHGVQTEPPARKSIGFVQEGKNYRKYRVEEKTPDGFIVGEYGVVSHDDGGVRGVRYTADGSINPRLIYEALVKFLSLK